MGGRSIGYCASGGECDTIPTRSEGRWSCMKSMVTMSRRRERISAQSRAFGASFADFIPPPPPVTDRKSRVPSRIGARTVWCRCVAFFRQFNFFYSYRPLFCPHAEWGRLVLRKVTPGSYWHQACTAEEAWKRKTDNVPREIAVNKPFYIGVFEITQRQYEHVTGMRPSRYSPVEGWEKLPVENVSYDDIRGRCEGADYPQCTDVDAQSFMGILRQKTGLKALDLPSESVWEYSCSAGGAYIDARQLDKNAIFSRYPTEASRTAPAEVGSRQPNALGLYDMRGNVHEWCLDNIGTQAPGAVPSRRFGCKRVVKGGFYDSLPELCNPSITFGECASFGNFVIGLRICCY